MVPRVEGSGTKDKLSVTTACLMGAVLIVPALAVVWGSLEWKKLQERASRAEAKLVSAQQKLASRGERVETLREVEASLRDEMSQLGGLVDQVRASDGIGVSRGLVVEVFDELHLVNKDGPSEGQSKHYAIEGLAGSIQLHGPPSNLTQIQFFGALRGEQAEASTNMLVTLLGAVVPRWEPTRRASWLSKLTRIDDDIRVYKDIDDLRLKWHWTMRDGVRLDVLSIEAL